MYTLRIETYHKSIEAIYHKDPSVKYEYVDFTDNKQGFITEIKKIVDELD